VRHCEEVKEELLQSITSGGDHLSSLDLILTNKFGKSKEALRLLKKEFITRRWNWEIKKVGDLCIYLDLYRKQVKYNGVHTNKAIETILRFCDEIISESKLVTYSRHN